MATRPAELKDVNHGPAKARLRLLAPLRYLAVHHPDKSRYDFWIPALIAVGAWMGYVFLFPNMQVLGEQGLLKFTRDLLVMAVPFLVGALATVAMGTPGEHMERRPAGADLLLDGEPLTLRRFVCYLLGYLCFIGLLMLVGVMAAELLAPTIRQWLLEAPAALNAIKLFAMFAFFSFASVLMITVLWALYFLTDVVNRH